VLLTRRALTKRTWPGVWTNSCCGHPEPGEEFVDAVVRRCAEELGVTATAIEPLLPRYRYRAVMADGTVENEICPVFRARTADDPSPAPDEVADTKWLVWPQFVATARDPEGNISPWCFEQVGQLLSLGDDPRAWPVASDDQLPPARR
jgi:isopentenyl-diphosphate Delta-isomerase